MEDYQEPVPPFDVEEATGRTRFRILTRWFRKPLLVLQVEYHCMGSATSLTGVRERYDYTVWRDAHTVDKSIIKALT